MKYKNHVKKITETLQKYMKEIDELESEFARDKKQHEQKIIEMNGKYIPQYIQGYTQNWKPDTDYATEMEKYRSEARLSTNYHLEQLKKQIDNYFNSPVRTEFVNRINAFSLTGITLKNREFQVLAETVNGYTECRLLNQLAMSRTKVKATTKIKDGEAVREMQEAHDVYHIELPDIDNVYEAFQSYKNCVQLVLDNYVGIKDGLFHFLGRRTPISGRAYFQNDMPMQLSSVLEQANALLPEHRVKRELSAEEKQFIDVLIDENYPLLAEKKVKKLATVDDNLALLFSLDERHSKYLTEDEDSE